MFKHQSCLINFNKHLPKLLTTTKFRFFNATSNSKYKINEKDEIQNSTHLNYRIVMIEKFSGHVSWKNCTGSYVMKGQTICELVKDDNTVATIRAPVNGVIANRFNDEGDYVKVHSLICLIKIGEKPKTEIDRQAYVYERKLYSELYNINLEELDSSTFSTESSLTLKRLQPKYFISLKDHDDQLTPLDELDSVKKKMAIEKLPDILDKFRKEQYEKYTPQYIREEIKHFQQEEAKKKIASLQDMKTDKINVEFYQELINENFKIENSSLHVINNGIRDKFLITATDIDLTNAIQFALNDDERNNLKFELKCLFLLGAVHSFKQLPNLICTKDKSINISVGIIADNKLAFPLIKNIDKMSFTNIKNKLITIESKLREGNDFEELNNKDEDCFSVTNEWDYGSTTSSSCLYISNYASLALNTVVIKPALLPHNYQIHFKPTMSVALTFNNERIHGQDALLFLNKLKQSLEKLDHITNF